MRFKFTGNSVESDSVTRKFGGWLIAWIVQRRGRSAKVGVSRKFRPPDYPCTRRRVVEAWQKESRRRRAHCNNWAVATVAAAASVSEPATVADSSDGAVARRTCTFKFLESAPEGRARRGKLNSVHGLGSPSRSSESRSSSLP